MSLSVFPTSADTFSNKQNGQIIYNTDVNAVQDAISAVESYLGTVSTTSSTSVTYLLTSVNSTSPGHVHLGTDIKSAVPVTAGGTGATTQSAAANNVLPSQTGNSGYYLQTNGTNASWAPGGVKTWIGSSFESTGRFTFSAFTNAPLFTNYGIQIQGTNNSCGFQFPYQNSSQQFYEFAGNPIATFVLTSAASTTGSNNSYFSCVIGANPSYISGSDANAHIGFRLKYTGTTAVLYATQADGTTENISAALITGIPNNYNYTLNLIVSVNSGTSATYTAQLNAGTPVSVTLTSNIPASSVATGSILSAGAFGSSGNSCVCDMSAISYQR